MLSKKDVEELILFLYSKNTKIDKDIEIERFKESFDYDTYAIISYMNENKHKLSVNEWKDIYNEHKENINVQFAFVKIQETPIEIVEDIIFNSDIIKKHIKEELEQDINAVTILLTALMRSPSNIAIDEIYNNLKLEIKKFPTSNKLYGEEKLLQMTPKALSHLCKRLATTDPHILEPSYKETLISDVNCYHLLEIVNNKELIKQLAKDEFVSKEAKASLINNQYLNPDDIEDAKIINELFEDIDNLAFIKNATNEIAIICSDYFYEGLSQCFINDNFDRNSTNTLFDTTSQLRFYSSIGKLTPEVEMKILNLVFDKNLVSATTKPLSYLADEIFANTKNKEVFNYFKKLPPKKQFDVILKNPNVPENIVKREAKRLFDTLLKSKAKGYPNTYSDIQQYACILGQRIELRPQDYKLLFELQEYLTTAVKILMSPSTPKKLLEDILNNNLPYTLPEETIGKIKLASRIENSFREGLIAESAYKRLKYFVNNIAYFTQSKPFDLNSEKPSEYLAHHVTMNLTAPNNEKEDVLNGFRNLYYSNDITKKEKSILSHGLSFVENYCKKESVFDKKAEDLTKEDIMKLINNVGVVHRFDKFATSYMSFCEKETSLHKLKIVYDRLTPQPIKNPTHFIKMDGVCIENNQR